MPAPTAAAAAAHRDQVITKRQSFAPNTRLLRQIVGKTTQAAVSHRHGIFARDDKIGCGIDYATGAATARHGTTATAPAARHHEHLDIAARGDLECAAVGKGVNEITVHHREVTSVRVDSVSILRQRQNDRCRRCDCRPVDFVAMRSHAVLLWFHHAQGQPRSAQQPSDRVERTKQPSILAVSPLQQHKT